MTNNKKSLSLVCVAQQ